MRRLSIPKGSLTMLFGLALLYVLLIVLVLVFSSRILSDLSMNRAVAGAFIASLAVIFSLILLWAIGINLFQLLRTGSGEKPGGRLKFRLILFFLLVILLSSIPQAILSINFIGTSLRTWFSARTAESLRGGLAVAMRYYGEKVSNLQNLSRSGIVLAALEKTGPSGVPDWETLRLVNPDLSCLQIFGADGARIFAAGNPEGFIEEGAALAAAEGLLPRETRTDGLSILRSKKNYTARDGRRRFAVFSVTLPRDFDGHAENLTSSLETFRQLENNRRLILPAFTILYGFFSFPLMLLAILVSFLLSDEIIRPIVNLEEATRKVADGDFSHRILSRSRDELSLLAGSFNMMVAELEKSRLKILQTEKVAAWQEIAQRLAREIKNPLTPIKLSAQRLQKRHRENPEDFGRILDSSVESIVREVDNLDNLLTEFRDFSRLPAPRKRSTRLKAVITEAAALYGERAGKIRIETDGVPEDLALSLDPDQIRRVFANLITNAVDAMPEGGTLRFRTDLVKKGNTRYCRIQVEDTGEGIDRLRFSQVFNPYYTTKSDGTGLGLSVVERIVFDHQGQIWFESEPGVGTTFFIDLPVETA